MPVEVSDAVTHGTERRHECRSDRHTGHHRAFILAREFENTGYTSEESDQYIVDRGVRTRQQFSGVIGLQRRHKEIERGRQQTDNKHNTEVLERMEQQVCIVCTEPHAKPDDRAHKRRDKHRADDYRDGVDIQTHGSDDDRHKEDVDIRSLEGDVTADIRIGCFYVNVVRQTELFAKIMLRPFLKMRVIHMRLFFHLRR